MLTLFLVSTYSPLYERNYFRPGTRRKDLDTSSRRLMPRANSESPVSGVSVQIKSRVAPQKVNIQRPKPTSKPAIIRNDTAGRCLREQQQYVNSLSDSAIFDACVQFGITQNPPPSKVLLRRQHKTDRVQAENLREQLADFNAFTQFMNKRNKPTSIGDGLQQGDFAELWVRDTKIEVHRKGTGLGENDDGTYQWVFWRDSMGVVRSALPPDGNAMVKSRRIRRWPHKLERWVNLSFIGRDANMPLERHRYFNRLSHDGTGDDLAECTTKEENIEIDITFEGLGRQSSIASTESEDTAVDVLLICDEFRSSNRYSTVGDDFNGLLPLLQINDPRILERMAGIRRTSLSDVGTLLDAAEGANAATAARQRYSGLDEATISRVQSLRKSFREGNRSRASKSVDSNPATNSTSKTDLSPQIIHNARNQKPLPPLPDTSIQDPSLPDTDSRIFLGAFENRHCTLLRLQTIEALKLYSNRDFVGFMELIHQHKSIITLDIRNNLNRGPVFSGAMVGYALDKLIQSSLTEYIPYENLKYVRDIMYHYLANRNLHIRLRLRGLEWRPIAFDTRDFNAMNYLDDEYCDGFFKEMQDIIRRGYGDTEEQRWKTGAIVNAILYVCCLEAMDAADKDNDHHAQNLIRSVTVAYMAAEALVLAAPIPKATYVDNYFLKPMLNEVTNRIQKRFSDGALRGCVVTTFRDTYVLGALRGERIPGMRSLSEDTIQMVSESERLRKERLLEKRREIGHRYLRYVRMYVNALGEIWPKVKSIQSQEGKYGY